MHHSHQKILVLFLRKPINLHVAQSALALPRRKSNLIYSALSRRHRLLYLVKATQCTWERLKCVCLDVSNDLSSSLLPVDLLKIRECLLQGQCAEITVAITNLNNKRFLSTTSVDHLYSCQMLYFQTNLKWSALSGPIAGTGWWEYNIHADQEEIRNNRFFIYHKWNVKHIIQPWLKCLMYILSLS